MNDLPTFFDSIRRAFQPTQRGIVGLVDDLLELSRQQDLQLDLSDGRCRVHVIGSDPEETIEVAVPRSVFRAAPARDDRGLIGSGSDSDSMTTDFR